MFDWERGRTLQLTGRARVTADGDGRLIEFAVVAQAVETAGRLPGAWL